MKAVDNKEFKDYVYAGFYPDKDSLMQTVLDVFTLGSVKVEKVGALWNRVPFCHL